MEAMISAKIPVFKVTSRARWEGGGGGGQLFEDQLLFKKMRYINTFYLFWYLKLPVDAALYSNLFR